MSPATAPVRRRTCKGCGNSVPVVTITTNVKDAKPVDLIDCGICDRGKCQKCGVLVQDRRAKKCTAGHWLGR